MKNITFIYAGAGSGKTHRLTSILTDYIRNTKLSANQVMLTTFTKKAANEIKERAQSELLKHNLFEQAQELNEAFIGTVHSVGYQFIKKYWYLLGISPEIKEIGENEKDLFFSYAISEVPEEKELTELNRLVKEFNFTSSDNFFFPMKWKQDVIDLMGLALTNRIDLENDIASMNFSCKQIKSIFKGTLSKQELKDNFEFNLNLLKENALTTVAYNNVLEIVKKIDLEKEPISISSLNNIISFNESIKIAYNANKYQDILNIFIDFDPSQSDFFQEEMLKYTQLIFDIAKRSLNAYSSYKKEKGLIDYTDMEVFLLDLLDKDEVCADIKNSLKLVMVDEFQDSNPIQLSIFMKLSELVNQSIWVGDPKQAIYSFRGSDPILIDEVMKKFTSKNEDNLKVEILKMSWRSDKELINFSNKIFSEVMGNQATDVFLDDNSQINGKEDDVNFSDWKNSVSIQPLLAKETISLFPVRTLDEKIKNFDSLNFWNFITPTLKENKPSSNPQFFDSLAFKVKSIIENPAIEIYDKILKKHRRIVGSDICFLVRSNSNVAEIAKKFKEIGLVVNASIPGLVNTIEYNFVKDIIILFLDYKNALSIANLAYLNGEFPNLDCILDNRLNDVLLKSKDLESEERKKYLAGWLEEKDFRILIKTLYKQSSHLSVSNTIRLIINQYNLFLKVASFGNQEVRQANLLRLVELADEYETYCFKMNIGSGLNGLFNFIESSSTNDQQANLSNKEAIQIMTYHKSKGLEWPIVGLLGLEHDNLLPSEFFINNFFKTTVTNDVVLDIENPLNNRVIEFLWWPFGTKKSLNTELLNQLTASDKYDQRQQSVYDESIRLMYVGITRSRDSLILLTNKLKELSWLERVVANFNFENAYTQFGLNSLNKGKVDMFQLDIPINFEKIFFSESEITKKQYIISEYFHKQFPEPQVTPFQLNPSKQPALKGVKLVEKKILHERLKFNNVTPEVLGNVLHHMLFLKNKSSFQNDVIRMNVINEIGIDVTSFIENTSNFQSYLNTTFSVLKEYPEFFMEKFIGNKKATGEADLVLELQNELVLIDYKSFPGKKEDIFNSNSAFYAGKYSGQLNLYKQMLSDYFDKPVKHQFVYYVVQGVLVEFIND